MAVAEKRRKRNFDELPRESTEVLSPAQLLGRSWVQFKTQHAPTAREVDGVLAVYEGAEKKKSVEEEFRALAKKLCKEHPSISTYEGIFGGLPHIIGVRLSVAD